MTVDGHNQVQSLQFQKHKEGYQMRLNDWTEVQMVVRDWEK